MNKKVIIACVAILVLLAVVWGVAESSNITGGAITGSAVVLGEEFEIASSEVGVNDTEDLNGTQNSSG